MTQARTEFAALSRIAERHAATEEQRRRASHPAAVEPHEAVRLVAGLTLGTIGTELGEPDLDDQDLLAALALVAHVRADVDQLELGLLDAARGRELTWQAIAQGMGLNSAQAAKQRRDRLAERQAVTEG
ncbi:DNA-binding protein [Actinoplanes sp. NPDC048796]|uniref:DNA-binding protein n=1 Tax=unclassified Actinoplanes TaxID=2626549 RepID=UPI0033EE6D2C